MIYRWLIRFFAACRERRDLETQVAFLAGELRDVKSEAKALLYVARAHERLFLEQAKVIEKQSRAIKSVNDLACQLASREDPGALDRWSRDRTAN